MSLENSQGTSRLPVWGFGDWLVEEFDHKALTPGTGASSNTTVFLRRADIIARDLRDILGRTWGLAFWVSGRMTIIMIFYSLCRVERHLETRLSPCGYMRRSK